MDTQQIDEKAVFNVARQIADSAARDYYLAQACRDNKPAILRIRELLRIHEEEKSFLESPAIPNSPPGFTGEGRSDSPPRSGEGPGEGFFDATIAQPEIAERPGTIIGPYKLLQQIGEGGMGVVFMAEQTEPIQRTVALKIIKPGMDTRQVIARFEAERQALAMMDHPNIARVLDAGTTSVAGSLREPLPAEDSAADAGHGTRSVPTTFGRPYFVMDLVKGVPITEYCDQQHLTIRQRLELFTQVCHAVQHAHQKGIIHRDLKPSNVLVAEYDGKPVPKIIDFGVAKATAQRLTERTMFTQYGQIVGTFEYMSPEQARFNQLDVDTRSDIYSLGVLLYELLAGSTPLEKERLRAAAFDEILRIIAEEDFPRPSTRLSSLSLRERAGVRTDDSHLSAGRDQTSTGDPKSPERSAVVGREASGEGSSASATIATNRSVEPKQLAKMLRGELDWIVMKCLEKDRNRRYETANNFAADIERYLHDEPVQACPPSAAYRFGKFARRNKRALATAIFAAIALLLVVGSFGWTVRDRAIRQFLLEQQVNQALDETQDSYRRDRMPEAMATLQRAEDLLASGAGGNDELERRVRQWQTDLEMVGRLDEIVLEMAVVKNEKFHASGADPAYREAFRKYGLDVESLDIDAAAARINAAAIKDALVSALDSWESTKTDWSGQQKLLRIAQKVDSDRWRNQFRRGIELGPVHVDLTRADEILSQPPVTIGMLAELVRDDGQVPLAVDILTRAQQRYPDDFWINHRLAWYLLLLKPAQPEKAIGFFRAAVALRPDSPGAYVNLGFALDDQGQTDEAIAAYRRAIELKPDYAAPYNNLGTIFYDQSKWDAAAALYRKAIELKPDYAEAYHNLGIVLKDQGKLDEAIAACRMAIELKPDYADAYTGLGAALSTQGKVDEALAAHHKAIELEPDNAVAHANMGKFLADQGKLDEAIAAYRQAIEFDPYEASAFANLGASFERQGKLDEALRALRKAIELEPDHANAFANLGVVLTNIGQWNEAIAAHRKAIELQPDHAYAFTNLGAVFEKQGKWDDAIAAHRKAIELKPDFAGAYRNLGVIFYKQGKWDEALPPHRKAIELQPDYADAHTGLGAALSMLGKWDEALAAYRKAIELEPDNKIAYVGLGHVLKGKGKLDEALAACCKAIELDPGNASARNSLGLVLMDQEKWDEALPAFRKAIELNPNFAEPYGNLGMIFEKQGKWDDAIAACRKAIELKPQLKLGLAQVHHTLGYALEKTGQLDAAIVEYREAVRVEKNPLLVLNLANALKAQGKWDEWLTAVREAEKLLTDFSGNREAVANLLSSQVFSLLIHADPKLRDPDWALELAAKVIALDPEHPLGWQVRGWACYRTGDWQASIDALEKSCKWQDNGVGDAFQWYFLAMAHWQLGHHDQARQWYDKAVKNEKEWPNADDLRRIGAEAKELLGIKSPQLSTDKQQADDTQRTTNDLPTQKSGR